MLRTLLFLILGVSAGFAFATFMAGGSDSLPGMPAERVDVWQGTASVNEFLPLAERLELLETTLDTEITLRAALQAELAAITEQMAELQGADGAGGSQDEPRRENFDLAAIQERAVERFGDRRRDDPDRRLNQLVEAGFSPDQAQHITERESELRLESLYAQYDAVREGEPFDPQADRFDPQDQLRQELGDASYERYLGATGQSTSISVQSVMAGSAGQTAGLQPGDQVVSYGGERVFSTSDLNQLILDGSPGQTVVVDVLRDGQQIQVYVPRGPIGITSGRGMFGGR
jgi:C-terminal processing protease CtpA/Prc